jgi:molybdate transport system permease protein
VLFSPDDWAALRLTLQLASATTFVLLILATPLAWWLARRTTLLATMAATLVTMPLVLPPTVLGFYLLVLLGERGPLGQLTQALGLGLLPFSFAGLLLASLVYSLPFAVQPLFQAFRALGQRPLEVAATLRSGPLDTFFRVVLPLSKSGLVNAIVMTFAHTVGEFGVVLMIGGSIPGRTRVVSVQIYEHVEALAYPQAHRLAGSMLVFCFLTLLCLQLWNRRQVGK